MTTTLRKQASWPTVAAWAGLVGPVLFTLTWVAQELSRIEEYSPIKETVSALEAGPNGWIQQANFVVFGVLTMAFAAGLYRAMPSKTGVVGSLLLFVSGVTSVLNGVVFPLREDVAGMTYDPGGHEPTGFVFFTSSALALVVISFALAKRPAWRSLAIPVRVAGILMILSNPIMGILVIPDDAPLHDGAGLAQRIIVLGLLFPARLAMSHRLLQSQGGQNPSVQPTATEATPTGAETVVGRPSV